MSSNIPKESIAQQKEALCETQSDGIDLIRKSDPLMNSYFNCIVRLWTLIFKSRKNDKKREIYFDGHVTPKISMSNAVNNQKYSVITFFPVVLFNQFKFFSNLFFLLTAISQFYPPLKVGYFFTYFVPLSIVLGVTMLKEAYDDFCRFIRDRQINNTEYLMIKGDKRKKVKSAALKVGDIIQINAGERIPADLVLLYTTEASGDVFIKTDQLDGETDWKLRKAIRHIQASMSEEEDFNKLVSNASYIIANPPVSQIYEFEGVFSTKKGSKVINESLTLENALWGSTVLATGTIYGMVVYTGKDTRAVMNLSNPRNKVGDTEYELDLITQVLFGVLVGISITMSALKGFEERWFIGILRFIILLATIIPISVRVNLDISRVIYSWIINNDKKIPGTVVRNSAVPEELGRIEYLLTDKTGTLTQNDMLFRKIALENGGIYSSDYMKKLKNTLKKSHGGVVEEEDEQDISPLSISAASSLSYTGLSTKNNSIMIERSRNDTGILSINCDISRDSISSQEEVPQSPQQAQQEYKHDEELRDMVTAISVCHNVSPVFENDVVTFQASSPDEIALVQTMQKLKVELKHRDQETISILNPVGFHEEYAILANFPFSSESKRMGIILKNKATDEIVFFLKGADAIMKDKISEHQRDKVSKLSEELALEGLRTLVFASKTLSEEAYWHWKEKYDKATHSLVNRQANINKTIELLEHNMRFLGITGVEDKLQEDVYQVIESFRLAGIRTWMLTGDKIETAIAIAITAGLKQQREDVFIMRDMENEDEIAEKLKEYSGLKNTLLVIDGVTLENAFKNHYRLFFESTKHALNVVCCRCSPKQKAEIAKGIRMITKKKTCAIGDGGNDVNMIQAANIGVGVEGKEGKQAALASDYSITKFKHVSDLILYHGRHCYKRSAIMVHFVLHRGLINSFIQVLFSLMFYNVSIMMYPGILTAAYTSLFTFAPVMSLVLESDINREVALKHPKLFRHLQSGRELNQKSFYIWLWKSIYQAAVIIIPAVFMFEAHERHYQTIIFVSYTALIVVQMLNVSSTLTKMHWFTLLAIIGSLSDYFFIIWSTSDDIGCPPINWEFLYRTLVLATLAWLPIQLFQAARKTFDPREEEIIMDRYEKLQKSKLQQILLEVKDEKY